jgi:hypothetical protein
VTDDRRVHVFDPTALVLLFAAHPPVLDIYERYPVAFPATAIGEANVQIQATENDWEAILLSPNVTVLDLTASGAMAASHGATLGMGHAMCEAERLHGVMVTGRAVNVYDQLSLPVMKL